MKQANTQFDFSAKPKVTNIKPKYRERDSERFDGTSLMNDPRIIRGNTYAAIIGNKSQVQPLPIRKPQKQNIKKGKERKKINFDTGFEPIAPEPKSGMEHNLSQTEPFVQTLRDKPIQYEKECQVDLFLDRPVERVFFPMDGKLGIDRCTQIQENDPQLFNFDTEVEPILEALLSKVVETSRMELFEEEQLKEKEKQKIEYEKRRHKILVQDQKLEANENRLKDEHERRVLQQHKSRNQGCFLQKKVISRIVSKHYLKNIKENTGFLIDYQGFFRSPLEIDLYERFMPWLYEEVLKQLQKTKLLKGLAEQMILEGESCCLRNSELEIRRQRQRRQKNNIE